MLREDYGALQLVATLQGETLIKVLLAVVFLAVVVGCGGGETVEELPLQQGIPSPSLFSNKNTYVTHSANRYFAGTSRIPLPPLKLSVASNENQPLWLAAKVRQAARLGEWFVMMPDGRRSA